MRPATRFTDTGKPEISTRERILEGTARLLSTSCLHSISTRNIAKESGANSALISYHFGSKEKLYEAIILQQFEAYREQVTASLISSGDIRQNLKNACAAIKAFHIAKPYWLILYFRELSNPSPCYQEIILPVIAEASQKATEMIQTGIDQGIFKPDTNPRHVVQSYVGMINYCFMTCRLQKDLNIAPATEIEPYLDFVFEMVLEKISVPSAL